MKMAFDLVKNLTSLFVFRTTNKLAHSQGIVELHEREEIPDKPYERNIAKNVMMPGNAKGRHVEMKRETMNLRKKQIDCQLTEWRWEIPKSALLPAGFLTSM